MKKYLITFVLIAVFIIGCKSTDTTQGAGSASRTVAIKDFQDAMGKELKLLAAHIDSTPFNRSILYNRDELAKEGMPNVYTLTIASDTVSGVGAPNRYSAPFSRGSDQAITIGLMRSTQMAPLVQPEKLQEHDFYLYMQNANEWRIVNGNLEIVSKDDKGSPVRLVFGL